VATVWPCPLPVDAYAATGRDVVFPRLDCLRARGRRCCGRVTGASARGWPVPEDLRAGQRCGPCQVTYAVLPAFVLAWRMDAAETIGPVIAAVAGGAGESGRRRPGWASCVRQRAAGSAGRRPRPAARDGVRGAGSRAGRIRRLPQAPAGPGRARGTTFRGRCGSPTRPSTAAISPTSTPAISLTSKPASTRYCLR
jgi:hypothetical protein